MRQCFGEALVAGERVGVQCADGLQGPERERERRRKKKKVSDGDFPQSVRISLKSIETVKYDLISASQLHSVSADCEFVVARVFFFFSQNTSLRALRNRAPQIETLQKRKRSITQLDVWVARV